jgi:hypothetical protein
MSNSRSTPNPEDAVNEIEEIRSPMPAWSAHDLQQKLDSIAARFFAALMQEGLDEKLLLTGLKFELVRQQFFIF